MKTKIAQLSAILIAGSILTGCGPDADNMKAALVRSGISAEQASCYAEKAAADTPTEPYDYIADLMNAGVTEKDAINKARRKFGAEFKTPFGEARKACVK